MRGASNEGRGPWRCQLVPLRHSSPYEEQNPGPWLCASEACAAGACAGMCVFITAVSMTKLFACGGGEQWRTCAKRDYELRPVWNSLPITH
jgi:hypothetical protein